MTQAISPMTRETILGALSQIIDPAKGIDVVSSGIVQGIVIREGHIGFSLEIDPSDAAAREPLRKACEEAVRKLPGVLTVTAVLTAHRDQPAAKTGHSHAGHTHTPAKAAPRPTTLQIPGVKSIIAVASGKGGVGKSTLAVNLALALSHLGMKVGLLDADIYGPSLPRMMGIKGRPDSRDGKKLLPMENFGLKCMSIGFMVDEETPMIWRGPMVQSALTQMMMDVEWGELDLLVVDMPPGTGDAQLTMVQRVPLAGAVIVSTPQEIALIDARKGLAMFQKTAVPILGIVENMSYFVSPGSGEKSYIFGQGGARRMAETLGCDFLGEVPLHMAIRETSDAGRPVVATAPDSAEAKSYIEIAERVAAKLGSSAPDTARKAPRISIEN